MIIARIYRRMYTALYDGRIDVSTYSLYITTPFLIGLSLILLLQPSKNMFHVRLKMPMSP